jgi:uncharacterized protein (TIGR03083 family)
LTEKPPIAVIDLFPEILKSLLNLLHGLSDQEWQVPTICRGWSVQDVALHLLGGDIGILSSKRDQHHVSLGVVEGWDELVDLIDKKNHEWVLAARRISPPLLVDLLSLTGPQVYEFFRSLDPYGLGGPVSWAGPEPAPVWLDLAREYTERWHHQQHIRDAVKKPGLMEPRYLGVALATFVFGLPYTFRQVERPTGTLIALTISGAAGGKWFLRRGGGEWVLQRHADSEPNTHVRIAQDDAWRLFTRGVRPEEVRPRVSITGEVELGQAVLDMVSIIAK